MLYIVSTHKINALLKQTFPDKYKLDLGKKYSSRENNNTILDIKDSFVSDFMNSEKALCYKVAIIGGMNIYTSDIVPDNQIWFYLDTKVLKKTITDEDTDIKKVISDSIGELQYS